MKKNILLATSAIVASSFFASQAAAQVEVTIGGQIEFQAGYAFSEDTSATGSAGMNGAQVLGDGTEAAVDAAPASGGFDEGTFGAYLSQRGANISAADRSGDFRTRTDNVTLRISNTADNGLTYGGEYRFNEGAERVRIYTRGAFGTVQMGDWDSAAQALRVRVPFAGTDRFGGDAADYIFNAGILSDNMGSHGGTKLVYQTAGTALDDTGLTFGLSYAPQSSDSGDSIDRTDGTYNDVGSVGLRYNGEFSGVGVRAGAGYEFGSAQGSSSVGSTGDYYVDNDGANEIRSNRNLSAFNVGAGIAVAGVDVGVQYIDRGASGNISGFSDETWMAGAAYTVGPWLFGVSYGDTSRDVSVSGEVAGDATRANYSVNEQRLGFGTTYSVAPGLQVMGDLAYINSDWSASGDTRSGENVSLDNDAWVGVVTTALSF